MVAISDLHQQAEGFQTQIFVKNTFVYVEDDDDTPITTEFHPRFRTSPADVCTHAVDLADSAGDRWELQDTEHVDAGRSGGPTELERSVPDSASVGANSTIEAISDHRCMPCISVRNTFVHLEDDDDELCVVPDRQSRSQSDPAKCSSLEELCSADAEKRQDEEDNEHEGPSSDPLIGQGVHCANHLTSLAHEELHKQVTINSERIINWPSTSTIDDAVGNFVNTRQEVMLCIMMCPGPLVLPVQPVPQVLPIGVSDSPFRSRDSVASVRPYAKSSESQATKAARRKTKSVAGTHSQTQLSEAQGPEDLPGGTTVVLRNLPLNYRRTMLLRMLDYEGFGTKYNFVYLPADFDTGAGLGYAFINLVTPEAVGDFWKTFDGYRKWMFRSSKVCSVGWSRPHQGLATHMKRFRNSPLMHESVPDEYRPILLNNGIRVSFPQPTQALRPPNFSKSGQSSNINRRNTQVPPSS